MDLTESLRMSWRSIRSHTLRSTLTTLGIIIGVAAVIVFVTLGTSLQADIIGDVAGQQKPVMSVWAGPDGAQGAPGAGAQPVFTEHDIQHIDATPGVNRTLQRGTLGPATFTRGTETLTWDTLVSVPPDYFDGTGFVAGRTYHSGAREIVLNRAAAGLFNANGSVTRATGGRNRTNASRGSGGGLGNGSLGNLSVGDLQNLSRSELRNLTGGNRSLSSLLQRVRNQSAGSSGASGGNGTNGRNDTNGSERLNVTDGSNRSDASDTTGGSNATDGSNTTGGNLSVGERVVVDLGGRTITATVVGITNNTALGPFGGSFGGVGPRFYVPPDPFYNTTVVAPGGTERERVYPQLSVSATDFQQVDPVRKRVRSYLENDSEARTLKPDSYVFNVQTNQQLLDRLQEIIGTLTDFIVAIAAISLLVGSIGIANIMLVSVTERTREIGIMKATGARRRDVLQLFVVEAVLLGVIGSVLGAALGALGGYVLTDYVDLPLVLDPWLFAGAIAVGIGVGVIAGVYPAWRAARTDPIDALRYE